jgi:hypothetical protein
MNSASKHEQKTNTEHDDYASKKKKLRPHPEDEELQKSSNSKKLKTGQKSVSKSKMSTHKKSEVTFSEKVEEIKDLEEDKENAQGPLTPLKAKSPSHASLKSVKEHQKTPYSKFKEGNEEVTGNSLDNSQISATKTNQPNFNKEILDKSVSNSGVRSAGKKDVTPTKASARKYEGISRSKSPLTKIREEKDEHMDKDSSKEKSEAKETEIKEEDNHVSEKEPQAQLEDKFTQEAKIEEKVDNAEKVEKVDKVNPFSSHKKSPAKTEDAPLKDTHEIPHFTSEKKIAPMSPSASAKKTPSSSAQKNPFLPSHMSEKKPISPNASAGKKNYTSEKKVLSSAKKESSEENKPEEVVEASASEN